MDYHDRPMQFRSSHCFQTKDKDDIVHFRLAMLMIAVTYLPLVLAPIFSFITIFYINHNFLRIMKQYSDYLIHNHKHKLKGYALTVAIKLTVSFVCGAYFIKLIVAQVLSVVAFNDYCSKVLHNSYYQYVRFGILLSTFTIIVTIAAVVLFHVWNWRNFSLTALCVSINFIHILAFFSPFMLLAFMQDPLLTAMPYLIIISYTFICIFVSVKFSLYRPLITKRCSSFVTYFIHFVLVVLGLIMDVCITLITTSLFAMGAFNESEAFQTLTISLLIGLLSYFILRPAYQKLTNIKDGNAKEANHTQNSSNNVNTDEHMDEVTVNLEEVDTHNNKNFKHTTV